MQRHASARGTSQQQSRTVGIRPSTSSEARPRGSCKIRSSAAERKHKSRKQRTQATKEGLGAIVQFAQGATSAAATVLQGAWENKPSLPGLSLSQVPVPELVRQWLPRNDSEASVAEDASLRSAQVKREAVQQEARRLEDQEEAALQLLQQQADANEAVRLLRQRASEGSLPGERHDGFKLGLVVEGGGMRGAVSGGSLQALHDLGLRNCFDAIYGSSAGAINATYFLSGQRHGVDIYSQDIANTEFCDLRRLLKKNPDNQRPALDLSYLLDYIMKEVKPLDWQAVVDSPIPLKVVASCLDTLQPVLLENFSDPDDLRECLRASAAVPEVAGQPVFHRGRRLVDAAVFEAIPFRAAIADGCTHIIALPTRPPYRKSDFLGKLIDEGVSTVIKRAVLSPAYMKEAWIRELEYQQAFGCTAEELLVEGLNPGAHLLPGMAGCHVYPVFPGAAASYSPVCIDAATIMLGIAEGRSAVLKIFGSGSSQLPIGESEEQQAGKRPSPATTPAPVTAHSRSQ